MMNYSFSQVLVFFLSAVAIWFVAEYVYRSYTKIRSGWVKKNDDPEKK